VALAVTARAFLCDMKVASHFMCAMRPSGLRMGRVSLQVTNG
jgi:hypothetical protein